MLGKFGGFLNETKQELQKVTWPTRAELLQATGVVIVATFIMACFIGIVDFLLSIVVRMFLR